MLSITNILTIFFLAVILGTFVVFIIESYKTKKCDNLIRENIDKDDVLESLGSTVVNPLVDTYKKSMTNKVGNGMKSNYPSSEFFNEESISKCNKFNLKMLDSASGTLVGLGLLGTFAGLTCGIINFHSDSADQIQASIQGLLEGMGTAFSTSLAGMLFSLLFTVFDKSWKNSFSRAIHTLTEKLDEKYYIDDMELMKLNQQTIISTLYNTLKSDMQQQHAEMLERLSYTSETGEDVPFANAVREILKENSEQSKALKSFSTDLALELNNGFDEVLSRQMQQKIVPLMESVDATTKAVVDHIDQMAETVSSPATDMMQRVVDDLKNSMQSVISEFSNGLSGSATAELENLASQLGTATQAMADFPKNMENISATLQVTIEEVKTAISEISKTSATANSTAMQQMQEQIAFATGSISNAIEQVKDVMSGISQSSQEQSNQMVSKLADAAEKMGTFLTGTISTLSSSVQQSVKDITDDVNSKQADLIALQEDTTSQTKKLLETFNAGLDRLEKMNEYISGTMNGFKQAQGEISISTGNLRTISGDMKLATELFSKGQNDYAAKLAQLQTSSQHGIDQVTELLRSSGQLSEEYAQKFEIIKQGLGSIFSQLQSGLSEYSRTVKDTTDKYLSQYTASLTQTTGALMSTIERQNEVTEMLNDSISRLKK